jgi:histidine ammonia-lyase
MQNHAIAEGKVTEATSPAITDAAERTARIVRTANFHYEQLVARMNPVPHAAAELAMKAKLHKQALRMAEQAEQDLDQYLAVCQHVAVMSISDRDHSGAEV